VEYKVLSKIKILLKIKNEKRKRLRDIFENRNITENKKFEKKTVEDKFEVFLFGIKKIPLF
jgi:hypothetical protein